MPIANDLVFDKEMHELVYEVKNKLAAMTQDFLMRGIESGKIKRTLRASELNQNILLATMQFESSLTDSIITSLAAATKEMEELFHKRMNN